MSTSSSWTLASLRDKLTRLIERINTQYGQHAPSRKKLLIAAVVAIISKAYWDAIREGPKIYCQRNEWTELIMALLSQPGKGSQGLRRFRPALMNFNGHISTLSGFIRALPASMPCTRELLTTPDGGHFALDWYHEAVGLPTDPKGANESLKVRPIVLILHGVNGHGNESYMRHLAHDVAKKGWRACTMTFRGCGDLALTSPQAYDASKTGDIDQAVTTIHRRFPSAPLFMVGFSLGANLMVKYLGEKGMPAAQMVTAAVALSNPWCFLPHIESLHFPQKPGHPRIASRIYSMLLAHEYKRYVSRHAQGALAGRLKEVTRPWKSMLTLRELDEHITVPLGGFRDLEHYMTESSCSEYLDGVSVPLLGINALDDPFVSPEALEHTIRKASNNPNVILVTTRQGGHIGWGEPFVHLWRASWAERLCVDFLTAVALTRGSTNIEGEKKQQQRQHLYNPRSRL